MLYRDYTIFILAVQTKEKTAMLKLSAKAKFITSTNCLPSIFLEWASSITEVRLLLK